MSFLYLIRGLPGSGKSTLAKKLAEKYKAEHWENDMFFIKNGRYRFVESQVSSAMDWCIRNAIDAMYNGHNVIVSNTFTRLMYMTDYLQTAETLKIPVTIIECSKDYGSIHGVPEEAMQRMRDRWVTQTELAKHIFHFSGSNDPLEIYFRKAEEVDFCVDEGCPQHGTDHICNVTVTK